MLSEVVAGVLLGYGLDYMLGTSKRWVVVGAIAGVAVSMVTVFRVALRKPNVGSGAPRGAAGEPPRERP
jgi:F0F1-type ATP synthase assembly protein I